MEYKGFEKEVSASQVMVDENVKEALHEIFKILISRSDNDWEAQNTILNHLYLEVKTQRKNYLNSLKEEIDVLIKRMENFEKHASSL